MKFAKSQYNKLEGLMSIARKPAKISNYKFMCAMLYIIENGCKWRALPKKYVNWHTIYMRFSRWSKNGTIAKSYCFFYLKSLKAIKKQKLLNEDDYIFFMDSTGIKVSPDANKNKNNQEQSIGRSKGGLTTKLHLCYTSSCPVVFRLSPSNFREAPEGRKLIESIYSKNNNYLLMGRAYEDDKTLAKNHSLKTVVPPKKKS